MKNGVDTIKVINLMNNIFNQNFVHYLLIIIVTFALIVYKFIILYTFILQL
jgi:hypothetical protein